MALSPIDHMIDAARMKCAKCGTPMGGCDCWTRCRCGWAYEKGGECDNPDHSIEHMGEEIANAVAAHMRTVYPEPMRHASGGFQKTLKAVIAREFFTALRDQEQSK